MKRSEAYRFRAQIEAAGQSKTDAEALEAPLFYPVWSWDTDYAVGDRVRYEEVLYRCLTAHTSQAAWTPDAAPSLWTRILIPDPEVIPEWEQPESTNPYMLGDRVTHGGKVWVSIMDNNVWEPGVHGWEEASVE